MPHIHGELKTFRSYQLGSYFDSLISILVSRACTPMQGAYGLVSISRCVTRTSLALANLSIFFIRFPYLIMLVSLIVSIFLLASSAFAQGQQCPRFTVRKEMNDLTEQEWQTYLSTIVESTRRIDPESGLTIWEAGVRRHSQFSAENHGSAAFLYFHRHYLTWMERKLQTINPNFAFFYW